MQYKKPEYCAMIEDYINSFRNRCWTMTVTAISPPGSPRD